MSKWEFVPGKFNGKGEYQQLGSIVTPDGLWFAAIERFCMRSGFDNYLIQDVIKVLNREMPDGKMRKHEKQGGKK